MKYKHDLGKVKIYPGVSITNKYRYHAVFDDLTPLCGTRQPEQPGYFDPTGVECPGCQLRMKSLREAGIEIVPVWTPRVGAL